VTANQNVSLKLDGCTALKDVKTTGNRLNLAECHHKPGR
jgi:hypothetical protein